jgi:hypothetical protein
MAIFMFGDFLWVGAEAGRRMEDLETMESAMTT